MICDSCGQPLDSLEWDTCEVCSQSEAQASVSAEWDARYGYELSVRAAIEQALSDEEEPF